mmetsp:Transcript_27887/g.24534  ORF Transcript_27887/g.24534 Transcript_27887/m.24534 type:complete len:120 (+) Transcript_27887:1615-1974(+)
MYIKTHGKKTYLRVAVSSLDPSYIWDYLNSLEYQTSKRSIFESSQDKCGILGIANFTRKEGLENLLEALKQLFEHEREKIYIFNLVKVNEIYGLECHSEDSERAEYISSVKSHAEKINE